MVKEVEPEQTTESGIVLPDTLKDWLKHYEDRRIGIGPRRTPRWFEGRLRWL